MEEESDEIGFEEQLALEKEQEEKNKAKKTRTDEDGTVFEWDEEKKAWFPKIDADFIAQYQMSYGEDKDSEQDAESKQKEYWDWYQNTAQRDKKTSGQDGSGENKEDSEDVRKQYFDYYNYYYGYEAAVQYCGYDYYATSEEQTTQSQEKGDQGQSESSQDTDKSQQKDKKGQKRKNKAAPPPQQEAKWFDVEEDKNTTVYVSGLPLDITDEEYKELMSKCGMVMYDPIQKKMKLKLYRDEKGNPKGDGRCCYIKVESVDLALKLLDESDLRGHTIKVERAKFTMKGDFDPNKRRKKLSNKEKRRMKEKQAKLFDWRPEKQMGTRNKNEKTVILKNMFDPSEFEEDPMLINDLRDDVRTEASKFGEVKNVKIFDNHPDGVMIVNFKEAEMADEFIAAQNHRWFSKRRIIAHVWDGRTKYEIEESAAEQEARLKKWENFLEKSEGSDKTQPDTSEQLKSDTVSQGNSVPAGESGANNIVSASEENKMVKVSGTSAVETAEPELTSSAEQAANSSADSIISSTAV